MDSQGTPHSLFQIRHRKKKWTSEFLVLIVFTYECFPARVSLYHMHVCGVCRGQNSVLDALTSSELKFQVLVSHYVDAGNQDMSPVRAANAQYCWAMSPATQSLFKRKMIREKRTVANQHSCSFLVPPMAMLLRKSHFQSGTEAHGLQFQHLEEADGRISTNLEHTVRPWLKTAK